MSTETTTVPVVTIVRAKEAVGHVLRQIRNRSEVGYYMGHGTESYALLTHAAAALFNEPIAEVRERFTPRNAADPRTIRVDVAGQAMYAACHRYGPAWETLSDYDRAEWARHERSLAEDFYGVRIEEKEGGEE